MIPPQAVLAAQNHLLAALPAITYARLAAHLEPQSLALGHVLYEPGNVQTHAFFPTTAIASLHYVTASGASAETAGVGNEGVVGVALFMGGLSTSSSAVVQTAGAGLRIEIRALLREFERGGPFRTVLLRYAQSLIVQTTQTAACYRHHSVEQQLSRFLLLTRDRLASGELVMTHELVSHMLGVRREGITEAAGNLQRAGCIRYRRGHITIVDGAALLVRACECYRVIRNEIDLLRRSNARLAEREPVEA
jgi:CRP-like cAMP-binding protein